MSNHVAGKAATANVMKGTKIRQVIFRKLSGTCWNIIKISLRVFSMVAETSPRRTEVTDSRDERARPR